ncbi:MAG: endolytic transglycosylase MltG [Patescibacteria group bacterium]|nr:endolytic transglycosylase MltG [Patescibacteria group bacterium]MDE2116330.1 endolytic transglycosylase MltG [Patescibacteria group bacterium]
MESGSPKYMSERPLLSPKNRWLAVAAALIVLYALYTRSLAAPIGLAADTTITVPKGAGLTSIADRLETEHVIRSPFAFKVLVVLFGGSRGVEAGDYYFPTAENAVRVAWRLTHSHYELVTVRVTIPEGTDVKGIASILAKEPRLELFNEQDFLKIALPREGYLFPDTYDIPPNATDQDIVDMMLSNYERRIQTLSADITTFGRPISQVMIMASIVEREANTTEMRQTVAGILWKRLDEHMPLQVDSAFSYVDGKTASKDISVSDLAIDSPYNTYLHVGLPPTPISNPGLEAIHDTVHPISTPYYYYLSDSQGTMHYAVTLQEHEANKAKYLGY